MNDWLDFNNANGQKAPHQTLDTEEIRATALSRLQDILFHLFPNGRIANGRFYIGNIHGKQGKSLIVDLQGSKAGCWHDFSEGTGGDIFNLWMQAKGFSESQNDFPKVLQSLSEYLGTAPQTLPKSANTASSKVKTPPTDELGAYTAKWDYHDKDGKLIACVYRYDPPSGKEFRLWDVVKKKASAPFPRPLYQIPLILTSDTVVIVEGEKCADSLISQGIAATTAMNGAKAPLEKTDWLPLTGKQVIIWPDNDNTGREYAEKLSSYLTSQNICSPQILTPPTDKPEKWDAADAVAEGFAVHAFLQGSKATFEGLEKIDPTLWEGEPPEREWIIKDWLPRGYVTALYGDGGVGKSLLSQQLMTCIATGKPWLGFSTTPLRVYGLMCEDDKNELWRRQKSINRAIGLRMKSLGNMNFISRVGKNNLLMTFDNKDVGQFTPFFNELLQDVIRFAPDVVILDTAADLFGGNEINRTQVRQFVQNACGQIARATNGAVLLCAHPSDSGIQRNTGTGGSTAWNNTVRSRWYITRSTEEGADPNERILSRKKSNYSAGGDDINILWRNGAFIRFIPDPHNKRLVGDKIAVRHELERKRKKNGILETIASEALQGRVYIAATFSQKFEDKLKLGSASTIKRHLTTYAVKGWVKFCTDYKQYGLPKPPNSQGYLCVQGMRLGLNEREFNPETGELERITVPFYPTHFKSDKDGRLCEVEDPTVWVEKNKPLKEEKNDD